MTKAQFQQAEDRLTRRYKEDLAALERARQLLSEVEPDGEPEAAREAFDYIPRNHTAAETILATGKATLVIPPGKQDIIEGMISAARSMQAIGRRRSNTRTIIQAFIQALPPGTEFTGVGIAQALSELGVDIAPAHASAILAGMSLRGELKRRKGEQQVKGRGQLPFRYCRV
jgi:hypothetical protein